eukprot:g5853.t1
MDDDDDFLFDLDRDKNPAKYGGTVETSCSTTFVKKDGSVFVKKLTKKERKRKEEKRRKEKIEHDLYWEEQRKLKIKQVIDDARKKKEKIVNEMNKKHDAGTSEDATQVSSSSDKKVAYDIANFFKFYTATDLYLCKDVWEIKKTNSRKIYFPCAVVPKVFITLQGIDETKYNDIRTKNVWRLGIKQPSKDGFKYVKHEDCILYDPNNETVQQILQEQSVTNKTYTKLFKKAKNTKRLIEYTNGLKEIERLYQYTKKEVESAINAELTQEEMSFKYEEVAESEVLSSQQRGARRQVNRATTNISTKKRTLRAGDWITYRNTLDNIAGSTDAIRRTRILEITANGGAMKLENQEEYIFTQDPTIQVTLVRLHNSNKDKKNATPCNFNRYKLVKSRMKDMDAILKHRTKRSIQIYTNAKEEIMKKAKEDGMVSLLANLDARDDKPWEDSTTTTSKKSSSKTQVAAIAKKKELGSKRKLVDDEKQEGNSTKKGKGVKKKRKF